MNRLMVAAATVCFAFSLTVSAQTAAASPPTQPQEISAEKRALLKELSEVMGTKKQAAEMFTMIEAEMSKQMADAAWETLESLPDMKLLTEAERQELKRKLIEDSNKENTKLTEALTHKVDIGQLFEDVMSAVYAKNFNEKELADLIAFYKSDTGRRSMELGPKFVMDIMSETTDRLMPIMKDVVRDVASTDSGKYRDQVAALAKAHHRRPTSKRKK